jgi:hypothetical protein
MKRRGKTIDINNLDEDTLEAARDDYQMYLP